MLDPECIDVTSCMTALARAGAALVDAADEPGVLAHDQVQLIKAAIFADWICLTLLPAPARVNPALPLPALSPWTEFTLGDALARPAFPQPLIDHVNGIGPVLGCLQHAVALLSSSRSDPIIAACARVQQLLAWIPKDATQT